jgi:hypothetical protein
MERDGTRLEPVTRHAEGSSSLFRDGRFVRWIIDDNVISKRRGAIVAGWRGACQDVPGDVAAGWRTRVDRT